MNAGAKTYEAKVINALQKLDVPSPDASNIGCMLARIRMWSIVSKYSENRQSAGWQELIDEGLLPPDDTLREAAAGEQSLGTPIKGEIFAAQIKVTKPRETFDKDAFIAQVAKKYKIEKHQLIALASKCVKQGKAPLTKSIIEI